MAATTNPDGPGDWLVEAAQEAAMVTILRMEITRIRTSTPKPIVTAIKKEENEEYLEDAEGDEDTEADDDVDDGPDDGERLRCW